MIGQAMIDLSRLTGELIDHERDIYFSIKDILLKGIVFTNLPPNIVDKIHHTTGIHKASYLSAIGMGFLVNNRVDIREEILPFYNKIFFSDDTVDVFYNREENKFIIKLIEPLKSEMNFRVRNENFLLKTDGYLDQIMILFIENLKSLKTIYVKREAEYLEFLGIINQNDYSMKRPQSVSKIKLHIDDLSLRIDRYIQNFKKLPVTPEHIYGYDRISNWKTFQVDLKEHKLLCDDWVKKNLTFWNKDEILYIEFSDMAWKYGKIIES